MKTKRTKVSNLDFLSSPNSQSCVDLQTLPTLGRSKASPLYPYLNSTYSAYLLPHTQLSRIRGRKLQETEITPQLVSQIVKTYFIPVFEAQRHRQKNLNTARTAQHSQSLSEIIESQLRNSKKKLKDLKDELKNIEKDKERKLLEVNNLKQIILNHQVNFRCGEVNNMRQKRKSLQFTMNKVVKDFESAKRKNEKETYKLSIEILQNSSLDDKANTLEHFNSLFRMKSENMGERLKGLFFANNQLSISNLNSTFNSKIILIKSQCKEIDSTEYSNCLNMQLVIHSIQVTAEQALDKIQERNNLKKDLKAKVSKYGYEKDVFSNEIRKNTEEKELNLKKFLETEKKSIVIEEEYEKINKRLKEINFRHKLVDNEEKICKNCKKYFIEKDNFNWSCTTHPSEYGESKFFYCCGATDREAPGCKKSKHVSEEASEQDQTRKTFNSTRLKCLTCGDFGHLSKECSRDPNPKITFDTQLVPKKQKKQKIFHNPEDKLQNSSDSDFSDIEFTKQGAGLVVQSARPVRGNIFIFPPD